MPRDGSASVIQRLETRQSQPKKAARHRGPHPRIARIPGSAVRGVSGPRPAGGAPQSRPIQGRSPTVTEPGLLSPPPPGPDVALPPALSFPALSLYRLAARRTSAPARAAPDNRPSAQDQTGTSRVAPPITCCRPCEGRLVSPRQSHHPWYLPLAASLAGSLRYRYLYRHSRPHTPPRHLSAHTRPSRETHPGHSPPPPVAQSSIKQRRVPPPLNPPATRRKKSIETIHIASTSNEAKRLPTNRIPAGQPYCRTAETSQRPPPFPRHRRNPGCFTAAQRKRLTESKTPCPIGRRPGTERRLGYKYRGDGHLPAKDPRSRLGPDGRTLSTIRATPRRPNDRQTTAPANRTTPDNPPNRNHDPATESRDGIPRPTPPALPRRRGAGLPAHRAHRHRRRRPHVRRQEPERVVRGGAAAREAALRGGEAGAPEGEFLPLSSFPHSRF